MRENLNNLQKSKTSRPTGIWVLTIYALLFVGLFPFLLSIFLLLSGNSEGSVLNILLSLPISLGAAVAAIGAWKGNEKARKALLLFVTLHYVFIAINNYILISSGQVTGDQQAVLWGRVIRGFLYPAVYIWYFNKPSTKIFYI